MKLDSQQPEIELSASNVVKGAKGAKVAILLGTYNGEQFLAEQLESICNQTHSNWQIWASDDGSDDKSLSILLSFQRELGQERLTIISGPKEGFVRNFLSLTCHANITAEYYAFADQDDIWELEKLERALRWLEGIPKNSPALYCSRTQWVDFAGKEIGLSPLNVKPPSFANALLQNIAGGNTMVFNNAARTILMRAGHEVAVAAHDWWTYLAITGCGGQVFYDKQSTVRYRQHSHNLIGSNSHWLSRLVRIRRLLQGQVREWNEQNIVALKSLDDQLTAESRKKLDLFTQARHSSFISRVKLFKQSGIYKQTVLGNLSLIFAIIFKKI